MMAGPTKLVPVPLELAFSIQLPGGPYTRVDLDSMLSKVTAQWRDFEPLSKEFHENYTARLNELLTGAGASSPVSVSSVKPVLVSIDRLNANAYSVVSIRSYVFDVNGEQISATKVNADAVVLRGSGLIRLTVQRALTDPSDVAQTEGEIAAWARATAGASPPADQVAVKP